MSIPMVDIDNSTYPCASRAVSIGRVSFSNFPPIA